MRLGVAGHNLFDIAFAWHLAGQRAVAGPGSSSRCCSAWPQGQAEAVRRDVGGLLLYTPVVHPSEFDVAIAYLVRRLEEGASSDNFMSAVFELARRRVAVRAGAATGSWPRWRRWTGRSARCRTARQDRRAPSRARVTSEFREHAGYRSRRWPANAAWGRAILARVGDSDLGR